MMMDSSCRAQIFMKNKTNKQTNKRKNEKNAPTHSVHAVDIQGHRKTNTVVALDVFQTGVTSVRRRTWFPETCRDNHCACA